VAAEELLVVTESPAVKFAFAKSIAAGLNVQIDNMVVFSVRIKQDYGHSARRLEGTTALVQISVRYKVLVAPLDLMASSTVEELSTRMLALSNATSLEQERLEAALGPSLGEIDEQGENPGRPVLAALLAAAAAAGARGGLVVLAVEDPILVVPELEEGTSKGDGAAGGPLTVSSAPDLGEELPPRDRQASGRVLLAISTFLTVTFGICAATVYRNFRARRRTSKVYPSGGDEDVNCDTSADALPLQSPVMVFQDMTDQEGFEKGEGDAPTAEAGGRLVCAAHRQATSSDSNDLVDATSPGLWLTQPTTLPLPRPHKSISGFSIPPPLPLVPHSLPSPPPSCRQSTRSDNSTRNSDNSNSNGSSHSSNSNNNDSSENNCAISSVSIDTRGSKQTRCSFTDHNGPFFPSPCSPLGLVTLRDTAAALKDDAHAPCAQ